MSWRGIAELGPKWLWFVGGLVGLVAGFFVFDRIEFASDYRQRTILSSYLPLARCENANFDVEEREDQVQDWRYVVRISGSIECSDSIKAELVRLSAEQASDTSVDRGLVLPGHESHDNEFVSFDFGVIPGSIIWIRDKT
jgi:hypothetical protein